MSSANDTAGPGGPPGRFAPTHWSRVFTAARTQSPEALAALEDLCRGYWQPLKDFALRRGASPADAEDQTQGFFASRVVTRTVLQGLDPAQGKFRTWLLNSFQNYLRNEWAKQNAIKRGGGVNHQPIDAADDEGHPGFEPSVEAAPDRVYDRAWAEAVLGQALARLRQRYEKKADLGLLEELLTFLPGSRAVPAYAETARRLGFTEDALKMRVSRLRAEFGSTLKQVVADTLANPADLPGELDYLISVLSSD